jgi:mannose PTS system EIIA component
MNAILIIGHAPLAHALRQCALHVFPDCAASVAAIDVQPNLSPEETLATARIALQQMRQPGIKGVLVLTDIFGATPSNVAQKLVDGVTSRLITGVNLPMLLRAVSYRHEPLDALVSRAVIGGHRRHAGRDAGGRHRAAEPAPPQP